ncbi:MAG: hypothetical protein V1792_21200 [Pseudomonadota bacterium]
MRSGVYPVIADMIVGNGNRKKDVQSLYLTVSDADLVDAIDRMRYDKGETEIWVFGRRNGRLQRCDVPVEIWLRCEKGWGQVLLLESEHPKRHCSVP